MTIVFFRSKTKAQEYVEPLNRGYHIKLRPIKVQITDDRAIGLYGIRSSDPAVPDPGRGDVGYVIGRSKAEAKSWNLEGVKIIG